MSDSVRNGADADVPCFDPEYFQAVADFAREHNITRITLGPVALEFGPWYPVDSDPPRVPVTEDKPHDPENPFPYDDDDPIWDASG